MGESLSLHSLSLSTYIDTAPALFHRGDVERAFDVVTFSVFLLSMFVFWIFGVDVVLFFCNSFFVDTFCTLRYTFFIREFCRERDFCNVVRERYVTKFFYHRCFYK